MKPKPPAVTVRYALAAVATLTLAGLAMGTAGARTVSQPPLPNFVRYQTAPRGGTLWQGVIRNAVVPRDYRPSEVYLPPGFSTATRYPVLYLLHGTPGSPYTYVDGLHIAAVADAAINSGRTRPFIAVIPPAGRTARFVGEWTGPWESYLVRDVVPWVDAHLPTLASPAGRALAGLSAGGYGAVDIGLRHPSVFGTLESWSGYFTAPHDGSLARMPLAALDRYDPSLLVRRETAVLRNAGMRFFLSSGTTLDRTTAAGTVAFARELSRLGLSYRLWLAPGGHDGRFWRAQLPAALLFAEPAA